MNSEEQAITLDDFFDALKHRCGDKYHNQLSNIANAVNHYNLKSFKETIKELAEKME